MADYYTFISRATVIFAEKAYQVAKQLGAEGITLKGEKFLYENGEEVYVATSCVDLNIMVLISLAALMVVVSIIYLAKRREPKQWHIPAFFTIIFITAIIFNIVRIGVIIHLFSQVAEPSMSIFNDIHQTVGMTSYSLFIALWAGLAYIAG